jgi:hypothetical protein
LRKEAFKLVTAAPPAAAQRNLAVEDAAERSALHSSEVLATLFDLDEIDCSAVAGQIIQ